MAIDFPNSPTSNQIYTSGGRSWIWNGSSWVAYTTTITADLIANGSITSAMIANGTIATADIAANAITSSLIAANAVTTSQIADRSVGSTELDNLTLNAQTGTSYTLVLTDAHKLVTLNNSSSITLTIPAEASVNFDIGDQVNLMQLGSGQVTVSGGVSVTIRSQGSKLKLNGQYATAVIIKIAADEWVLVGNTAA